MYNILQDAGNQTRVAATAARCATNELHTSLNLFLYFDQKPLKGPLFIDFTFSYSFSFYEEERNIMQDFLYCSFLKLNLKTQYVLLNQ